VRIEKEGESPCVRVKKKEESCNGEEVMCARQKRKKSSHVCASRRKESRVMGNKSCVGVEQEESRHTLRVKMKDTTSSSS